MREVGRAEHASTEQLSALLDSRAEPDEQPFLAGHVDRCVVCANELDDLRAVRDLLRALPVYMPPRSFTIPIEAAPPPTRRFARLIPLTRALGALAAVLCVVLFSLDAMRLGADATMAVPEGAGAMQLTTRATLDSQPAAQPAAQQPAAPQPAARAASESARPADAAPKIAEAPAKPAVASGPADTARASGAGSAPPAAPAAEAAPPAAMAPAPAPKLPAATPQPTGATVQAQAPPGAALTFVATPAAAVPTLVPTLAATRPPAQTVGGAAAPTVAAGQRVEPPSTVASPWLSPIRIWSLAFAVLAAVLLIGSFVLSRAARRDARGGWRRT